MGRFVVDLSHQHWFVWAVRKSAKDGKHRATGRETLKGAVMNAQELLQEISDYCRQTGLAESTFGRRAVNDGKLASRLRHGGRITTETLDRIRYFMASNRSPAARPTVIARAPASQTAAQLPSARPLPSPPVSAASDDPQRNFRFFDNRQKYLLFVNTCS
jgi:hypothetical protein